MKAPYFSNLVCLDLFFWWMYCHGSTYMYTCQNTVALLGEKWETDHKNGFILFQSQVKFYLHWSHLHARVYMHEQWKSLGAFLYIFSYCNTISIKKKKEKKEAKLQVQNIWNIFFLLKTFFHRNNDFISKKQVRNYTNFFQNIAKQYFSSLFKYMND